MNTWRALVMAVVSNTQKITLRSSFLSPFKTAIFSIITMQHSMIMGNKQKTGGKTFGQTQKISLMRKIKRGKIKSQMMRT